MSTLKAAFKAYAFNKCSDFCLFFGIIIIYNTCYSLDILTIVNQITVFSKSYIEIYNFQVNVLEIVCLFFLGAAFIKSAQIGAHI